MTKYKFIVSIILTISTIGHSNINSPKGPIKNPPLELLARQAQILLESRQNAFGCGYSGAFRSFDPIDSNFAGNSLVTRLIYAQFISNDNGKLSSDLFDFTINKDKKVLNLSKIKYINFSDGTELTTEDAVLSIKRLLLKTKGNIPGLSDIKGVKKWLKNKYPLTKSIEGISLSKQKITITFNKLIENIEIRFLLPQLGIVPSKYVDLKTNRLIWEKPVFSGRFLVVDSEIGKNKLHFPTFIKLKSRTPQLEDMWIFYVSPNRIPNYKRFFHENLVIAASRSDLTSVTMSKLNGISRIEGPVNHFYFLLLNDTSKTFKDRRVRQYFVKKFRETINHNDMIAEGSIFTKIMSGYMPLKMLERHIKNFSDKEEKTIVEHLRNNPPLWNHDGKTLVDPFSESLYETLKELKIPFLKPKELDHTDAWNAGIINIRPTYMNLSVKDYTGDAKRVFSRGPHFFNDFVTKDPRVIDLVSKLRHNDEKSHFNINKYLFVDSKFAVISHFNRIFLTPGKPDKKDSFFGSIYDHFFGSPDKFRNLNFLLHSPEAHWFFIK